MPSPSRWAVFRGGHLPFAGAKPAAPPPRYFACVEGRTPGREQILSVCGEPGAGPPKRGQPAAFRLPPASAAATGCCRQQGEWAGDLPWRAGCTPDGLSRWPVVEPRRSSRGGPVAGWLASSVGAGLTRDPESNARALSRICIFLLPWSNPLSRARLSRACVRVPLSVSRVRIGGPGRDSRPAVEPALPCR